MIQKRKPTFKIKVGDILLYNAGAMTEWHLVLFVGDDCFKTHLFFMKNNLLHQGPRSFADLNYWDMFFRKLIP
jgi:hypothetical protein